MTNRDTGNMYQGGHAHAAEIRYKIETDTQSSDKLVLTGSNAEI